MPPFYGFLSNCYTSALVSPEGSIDWLAAPRFDGEAVFCRLLDDEHGGFFAIRPDGAFQTQQRYVDGTNILCTRFESEAGAAEVTDYLVIGRKELRRLVDTEIPLKLVCRPRFEYGLVLPDIDTVDDRTVFRNPRGESALSLTLRGSGVTRLGRDEWQLMPGRHEVILHISNHAGLTHPPDLSLDAQTALDRVAAFWRTGPPGTYEGPEREAYRRSLLVLRGLTYRTNGAILAAATTSLPEVVGGERQWDYRFVWVRDGSYAAEALLLSGDVVAVRRFLEFLLNSVNLLGKPFDCPFFRVDGFVDHGERTLGWLKGYRESRPVRVGNGATTQTQLDIEGDMLWVLWRYVRTTADTTFLHEYWWAVDALCTWVMANWKLEDASLWEFRDQSGHYTHSLLMLWVALSCGADLAAMLGHDQRATEFRKVASRIRSFIDRHCVTPSGRFRQATTRDGVDAALLCLALYGFVPADDPRFVATLQAIEQELVDDDLVYRYREDMLGEAAHPFTLASFWLARVYLRLGRFTRAQDLLQRVARCRTDLGLWSEHYDVKADEPRGNFPQLFPHAGHIMVLEELQRLQQGKTVDEPLQGHSIATGVNL